jgi:hypothetical protein
MATALTYLDNWEDFLLASKNFLAPSALDSGELVSINQIYKCFSRGENGGRSIANIKIKGHMYMQLHIPNVAYQTSQSKISSKICG